MMRFLIVLWVTIFHPCIITSNTIQVVDGFQSFSFPKIPNIFQSPANTNNDGTTTSTTRSQQESMLLEKINNTQFGKSATITQQRQVLQLVSDLEQTYPSKNLNDIIGSSASSSDKNTDKDLLDGTWYLQFTSPSVLEDEEGNNENTENNDTTEEASSESESWTIENAEENITTKRYNAKGSVSAGGINVELSLQPPKQIFDLSQNTLINEVVLDSNPFIAFVRVGGTFRLSEKKENRAVVAFNVCQLETTATFKTLLPTVDLSFLFRLIALIKGTTENGWLETTYLSDTIRIGRGNKVSMFVLTRNPDAVTP